MSQPLPVFPPRSCESSPISPRRRIPERYTASGHPALTTAAEHALEWPLETVWPSHGSNRPSCLKTTATELAGFVATASRARARRTTRTRRVFGTACAPPKAPWKARAQLLDGVLLTFTTRRTGCLRRRRGGLRSSASSSAACRATLRQAMSLLHAATRAQATGRLLEIRSDRTVNMESIDSRASAILVVRAPDRPEY